MNSFIVRVNKPERGAVMVMAPFIFLIILAFAGLAIDAGNLFRSRLLFQNASDAAVFAAIGYTIINNDLPAEGSTYTSLVKARALEIAKENLLVKNFDINEADIQVEYESAEREIRVIITKNVELYLIGGVLAVMGGTTTAQSVEVSATSTAKRHPANVVLALDFSDSMRCPSTGDCACLESADAQACENLGVQLKIDDLQEATTAFLSRLKTIMTVLGLPFLIFMHRESSLSKAERHLPNLVLSPLIFKL